MSVAPVVWIPRRKLEEVERVLEASLGAAKGEHAPAEGAALRCVAS